MASAIIVDISDHASFEDDQLQELQSMFPQADKAFMSAALTSCNGNLELAAAQLLDAVTINKPLDVIPSPVRCRSMECIDVEEIDVASDEHRKRPRLHNGQETDCDAEVAVDDVEFLGFSQDDDRQSRSSASSCLPSGGTCYDNDLRIALAIAKKQERELVRRRLRDEALAREMQRLWSAREANSQVVEDESAALAMQVSEGGLQGSCRFCDAICLLPSCGKRTGSCSKDECVIKAKQMCDKILSCGHACCGIFQETECDVPCFRCGPSADESCGICLDKLSESAVIHLRCGHLLHLGCALGMIENADWRGRRIMFSMLKCPSGCGQLLEHPHLSDRMAPFLEMKGKVEKNVVQRAERDALLERERIDAGTKMKTTVKVSVFETCWSWKVLTQFQKGHAIEAAGPLEVVQGWSMVPIRPKGAIERQFLQLAQEAEAPTSDALVLLSKYAYFECYRCREPYCGGLIECAQNVGEALEPKPETVQCNKCQLDGKGGQCPIHGSEFMAVKCDFCCNEALFRCFGNNTMFCQPCHSNNASAQVVKPCDPSRCPLRGNHPEGRTHQWMMGCAACRE